MSFLFDLRNILEKTYPNLTEDQCDCDAYYRATQTRKNGE